MSRKAAEPEEAIGPVVDGLKDWQPPEPEPVEPEPVPTVEEQPEPEESVALVCGTGARADAVARLAEECGFMVQHAVTGETPDLSGPDDTIIQLENLDNFVEECAVGRNHFVCIFLENAEDSENILRQCLASDAFYLGAWADEGRRKEIFSRLRQDGAPDAELAAICCPMGLALDTQTPQQDAVAIVAEMLAARAGVLKRLRQTNS